MCKDKIVSGLSEVIDCIKKIDLDWTIHLVAEVKIDGMDIKVSFDRPEEPTN
jgi:hypothetical protein